MAHDIVYGICENKCFVEVSPKTDVEQAQADIDAEVTARQNADTTLQSNINGKVSKSGDTMTGNLTIEKSDVIIKAKHPSMVHGGSWSRYLRIVAQDKNSVNIGEFSTENNETKTSSDVISRYRVNGTDVETRISAIVTSTGDKYGTVPTPSSPTDSSTKIATTEWVNNIGNDVVHKSRNETISGVKTFTSAPVTHINGQGYIFKNNSITRGNFSANNWNRLQWADKGGLELGGIQFNNRTSGYMSIQHYLTNGTHSTWDFGLYLNSDGTSYAIAPSTPSSATSNEIATADWVNSKLEWTQVTTEPTSSAPLSGVVSISDDVVTFLKDVRIDVYNYCGRSFFGSVVINKGTKMDNDLVVLTPAIISAYTDGYVGFTEVRVDFNGSGLYISGTSRNVFNFKTSSYTNSGTLTFTTGTLNASTPGYSIYTRG